ncbi:hypothetical protein [Psychrobacter sp. FDAARGOS_221]|uniref:hypothetical protein n=1 Tax=Psychrobacter sp. FDAARGOS_221 TaxID=1975705 RepID=UPI000BB58EFD|nr:hypothetical protein [Psychrobacter sp. FDAARGOS_221]PNK61438.1 hypothetical protein A6J60_011570 [Psychrobacter sp. FDAARGOS_221]
MKTVIVKVHNSKETIQEIQVVTKDGQPDVIKAVKNVNYEFFDESIGRAPNHIITKRINNALHVSFEREGKETDLIIEDFYSTTEKQEEANQIDEEAENQQALIGIAEDGSYYYYIPDTGEVYDYVTQLEVGATEGQALGGEELYAPWWVAAPVGFPWWLAGLGIIPFLSNDDDDNYTPPNNKPIAEDDIKEGNVGDSVVINVLENDKDPDGDLDPTSVQLIDLTPAVKSVHLNLGDFDQAA